MNHMACNLKHRYIMCASFYIKFFFINESLTNRHFVVSCDLFILIGSLITPYNLYNAKPANIMFGKIDD